MGTRLNCRWENELMYSSRLSGNLYFMSSEYAYSLTQVAKRYSVQCCLQQRQIRSNINLQPRLFRQIIERTYKINTQLKKINCKRILHDTDGYAILLQRRNITNSYVQYDIFLFIYICMLKVIFTKYISSGFFLGSGNCQKQLY